MKTATYEYHIKFFGEADFGGLQGRRAATPRVIRLWMEMVTREQVEAIPMAVESLVWDEWGDALPSLTPPWFNRQQNRWENLRITEDHYHEMAKVRWELNSMFKELGVHHGNFLINLSALRKVYNLREERPILSTATLLRLRRLYPDVNYIVWTPTGTALGCSQKPEWIDEIRGWGQLINVKVLEYGLDLRDVIDPQYRGILCFDVGAHILNNPEAEKPCGSPS